MQYENTENYSDISCRKITKIKQQTFILLPN